MRERTEGDSEPRQAVCDGRGRLGSEYFQAPTYCLKVMTTFARGLARANLVIGRCSFGAV